MWNIMKNDEKVERWNKLGNLKKRFIKSDDVLEMTIKPQVLKIIYLLEIDPQLTIRKFKCTYLELTFFFFFN